MYEKIEVSSRKKKGFLFPHTKPPRHKDLWYIPTLPCPPHWGGERGRNPQCISSFFILCGSVSLCDYFSYS